MLLIVLGPNFTRARNTGSGSLAVTALQGRGSVIELGEADKHPLARGASTHTLQLSSCFGKDVK